MSNDKKFGWNVYEALGVGYINPQTVQDLVNNALKYQYGVMAKALGIEQEGDQLAIDMAHQLIKPVEFVEASIVMTPADHGTLQGLEDDDHIQYQVTEEKAPLYSIDEMVEVQPMTAPSSLMFYLDYEYGGEEEIRPIGMEDMVKE